MTAMLDMITGGSQLPYVYCRKITLDRSEVSTDLVDVTLMMEMYQSKDTLSNSTWLNSLVASNMNLMDAMFMQVLVYTDTENVSKMMPSTNPTIPGGNVYTGKQFFDDAFLPRGEISQGALTYGAHSGGGKIFQYYKDPLPPIQISNSSLLGDLTGTDALLQYASEGKVREEIKNGKSYYIIPFEWKYTGFDPKGVENSLGFAFYTFLNITYFLQTATFSNTNTSIDFSLYSQFFEQFMVEGPVNAEVVYINGEVNTKRDVFIQSNGLVWEGSVHLHTEDNPAPDGYQGNGGYGDNTGWMAGEQHVPGEDQSRLSLVSAPNNIISDFRHSLFDVPLDTALGLGQETSIFNLGSSVSTVVNEFLSPFQKEKRSDFIRDNDSEFSRLYICRDKNNNARGFFSIDILELLKNNSSLFPTLDPVSGAAGGYTQEILDKSRILELRVYRDRVKKRVVNTRYEKYANDEIYEEPSRLVATLSDRDGYQIPSQNLYLAEVTGIRVQKINEYSRYFMFTDTDVGEKQAGLYRYRVELEFKDGTYEFLYQLYRELAKNKVLLDAYYDLSQTSYVHTQVEVTPNDRAPYFKNVMRSYFDGANFEYPQFYEKAIETFANTNLSTGYQNNSYPWQTTLVLLFKVQQLFKSFAKVTNGGEVDFFSPEISNLIDPQAGSPRGINFFSRIVSSVIDKLQRIMDATKVNKTGSEIDDNSLPNGYSLNNILDVVVSPSDSTISEEHTFDHPAELFEALTNENVYMDYLSIGTLNTTEFSGLRSISPEYYIDRCKLDSAKLSPHAIADWDNVNVFGRFVDLPDSFANTGYSFLTPSIIELSDPSKEVPNYKFFYTSFSENARDSLAAGQGNIYSSYFTNVQNYDRLLVGFLNYTFEKQDSKDADLTGFIPHNMPQTYGMSPPQQSAATPSLGIREPYKKLFDNISLTVHDKSLYDKFFDRPPGASSIDIPDIQEFNHGLGLNPQDFSDGSLQIYPYLKTFFLSSGQSLLRSPTCWPSPYEYSVDLPNSFKIHYVHKGRENVAHPLMATALNDLPNLTSDQGKRQRDIGQFASFFFFQTSLTARIQVYRGSLPNQASKNDEKSWRDLRAADLQLSEQNKLFCRIVLYDESLLGGIIPPVLDKYFLIYPGGDNPLLSPVIPGGYNVSAAVPASGQLNVTLQGGEIFNQILDPDNMPPQFWETQIAAATQKQSLQTATGREIAKNKDINRSMQPGGFMLPAHQAATDTIAGPEQTNNKAPTPLEERAAGSSASTAATTAPRTTPAISNVPPPTQTTNTSQGTVLGGGGSTGGNRGGGY